MFNWSIGKAMAPPKDWVVLVQSWQAEVTGSSGSP